jgi:hypothetical protein
MVDMLLTAVINYGIAEIQSVLEEGNVTIDTSDERGKKALMFAVECDDVQEVRWLLETGGANASLADDNGDTALMHALHNSDMVRYLLEEGTSSIDHINKRGDSLLLFAEEDTCILEHGADIALTNYDGYGIWEILELDLDTLNQEGEDAAAFAALLLIRGATPEWRARLVFPPEYLALRRTLLKEHCQLIPPLQALICAYGEPSDPDEHWATISALKFGEVHSWRSVGGSRPPRSSVPLSTSWNPGGR